MFKIFSYGGGVFLLTYLAFLTGGARLTTYWSDPRSFQERPPRIKATRTPTTEFKEGETLVYRTDLERTGFVREKMGLNLTLKKIGAVRNLKIHTASKASPVVLKDGSILIGTDGGRLSFLGPDGKEIWRTQTYQAVYGFHSTPAIFGNLAIVGDYTGLLAAYDLASGKPQWMIPLGSTVGSSPLVDEEGFVYAGIETANSDGFFVKLNARDGEIIWQSEWLGEQTHASPALSRPIAEFGGDRLILGGDNAGHFNAISAQSGKFIWRLQTGGPVKGTPAVHRDRVYFSSWDEQLRSVELTTGKEVWRANLGHKNQSSVAVLPDGKFGFIMTEKGLCRFALADRPDLTCDRSDPSRLVWQSSPVISERADKPGFWLWSSCDEKSFCVYDPHAFRRVKSWVLPEAVSGEARIRNGRIVLMPADGGLLELSR